MVTGERRARRVSDRMRAGVSRLVLAAAVAVSASACAVTPEPVTVEQRLAQARDDRSRLFADQEPVTGPITLAEAMARAIKYNLDSRQALMEEVLQARQLDVTSYDMLPRLAASAGYLTRAPSNESLSRNTITNFRSIDPAISQDDNRFVADLGLTWNVLDFGVSYYQAKQQSDRVLIAHERRRRLINSIIQQVRGSYWLAVSSERILVEIEPLLAEARQALADAQQVEEERLRPPLEALRYQKALLEIIRQLEMVQQDLSIAKAQLAALMNVPLGQSFTLALPEGFKQDIPQIDIPIERMETAALLNRPEMREEQYQSRINAQEVRKAMLRMLPGINLNTSLNFDSNSYLVNNAWAEAGARLTLNLFNVFTGPANIAAAEAQVEAGEFRRLALSMATLTQVHVAVQQYKRTRTGFEQARLMETIEQRINENIQQAATADAESSLERIRAGAQAITAKLARDRAYAELQNAVSSLYVSLGLDPVPETVDSHDIKGLTAGLTPLVADWMAGRIRLDMLPAEEAVPADLPAAEAPEQAMPEPVAPHTGGVPVAAAPSDPSIAGPSS